MANDLRPGAFGATFHWLVSHPNPKPAFEIRTATLWLVSFLVWTGDGLLNAANYHQMRARDGAPIGWEHVLRTSLIGAWLWVPLTVGVFWLSGKYTLSATDHDGHDGHDGADSPFRSIAIHIAGNAGVILVRALVVYFGNPWVGWYNASPSFASVLLTSVGNNLVLYWLIAGVAHALLFARRSRQNALHASKLEAQLARARLAALEAQLHPHFLFNTLHSLSELVHRDAAAADRMIVRLSELLRQTLAESGAHEVALRDEMERMSPYLEIEQIRFGDRLSVEWDIEAAALDARVPTWILQPLIENSLRHGLSRSASAGHLRIAARARDGRLRLEVCDDGPGPAHGWENRAGVGIANTRARLRELYGDDQRFSLVPAPSRGAIATIDVPLVKPA